jgi:hypothetical protein
MKTGLLNGAQQTFAEDLEIERQVPVELGV